MPKFIRKSAAKLDSDSENKIVETAKKSFFRDKFKYLVILLLVILLCGLGFYFYIKSQGARAPQVSDSESLLEKIGKHVFLPRGEIPTIATVTDKTKLAQKFFDNADNGDKILLFGKAQIAVLYRPSTDLVINMAPFNMAGQNTNSLLASGSASQNSRVLSAKNQIKPKVTILNGTKKSGLAKSAQAQLKTTGVNIDILSLGNTSGDFQDTRIIDITGRNTAEVGNIIKALGGEGTSLPEGESAPKGTDILIILGADFIK